MIIDIILLLFACGMFHSHNFDLFEIGSPYVDQASLPQRSACLCSSPHPCWIKGVCHHRQFNKWFLMELNKGKWMNAFPLFANMSGGFSTHLVFEVVGLSLSFKARPLWTSI